MVDVEIGARRYAASSVERSFKGVLQNFVAWVSGVPCVGMAKELVADELREAIEPLLPRESPKPNGGRSRIENRAGLTGVVFVLKSGIPWEMIPKGWDAATTARAGDASQSDEMPERGNGYTASFSTSLGRPTRSTESGRR